MVSDKGRTGRSKWNIPKWVPAGYVFGHRDDFCDMFLVGHAHSWPVLSEKAFVSETDLECGGKLHYLILHGGESRCRFSIFGFSFTTLRLILEIWLKPEEFLAMRQLALLKEKEHWGLIGCRSSARVLI